MIKASKTKHANNAIMYNKIRNTWSYADILGMYEADRTFGDTSYFLFSKDLKHVWLISWVNARKHDYEYTYLTDGELLHNLTVRDGLSIQEIAKILGLTAEAVYESIGEIDLLDKLLPTLKLDDAFKNDKELHQLVGIGGEKLAKLLDEKQTMLSKPYCVLDVANHLIQHFVDRNIPINNMFLNKMIYYLQADSLRQTGKPLFKEQIEKWGYGAIQPGVFSYFNHYGAAPIVHETEYVEIDGNKNWHLIKPLNRQLQVKDIKAINKLADEIYYKYHNDPYQLVVKTQNEPMWKEDESKIRKGILHIPYDNEEIREYFTQPNNWEWGKNND